MSRRPVLVAAALAAAVGLFAAVGAATERSIGEQLFHGRQALNGRISGHDQGLPAMALRCANCHQAGTQAASGQSYGPSLGATLLKPATARRGGPPSRYDEAGFCRLLRTGIDPAWVQIGHDMPRYELSDLQCAALWAYVSEL